MRTAPATCGIVILLLSSATFSQEPTLKPDTVTKSGKVVLLAPALETLGLAIDADPISTQVALKEEDGTITPLLSDQASRAFFQDERMRDRTVELTVRQFARIPYLQVVSVKVEADGVLRIPEYYCEVCSISVRYPQTCPCCQGPMEFRMKP